MSVTSTDRIEKSIVLRAPRSRVWQALSEARAFGQWFGVDLAGAFAPGAHITGRITHQGYEHIPFEIMIERMESERALSWRWHVIADPDVELAAQPTTLVEFELQDAEDGTLLTVVESGFDGVPPEHRARVFRGNEEGWAQQMQSIERYLTETA